MKKLFYTSIILLFLILCSACSNSRAKKYRREIEGLRGNVKSVLCMTYEFVNKFGEGDISKTAPLTGHKSFIEFDSIGNILLESDYVLSEIYKTEENIFNEYGQLTNNKRWNEDYGFCDHDYSYEYDEYGTRNSSLDNRTHKKEKWENIYDERGRLLKKMPKDYTEYNEYNDDGKLIRTSAVFKNSKFEMIYRYDDKGNVIYTNSISPFHCSYYFKKYDNQNRISETIYTEVDDINSPDFEHKELFFYEGNSKTPSCKKKFNCNGELIDEEQYISFIINQDTVCNVTINSKNQISELENVYYENGRKRTVNYKIRSYPTQNVKYTYYNGELISSKSGDYENKYEYKNNHLIKMTEEYNGTRNAVYEYKNGRIVSRIGFDENDGIEYKFTYSYKGDDQNGIEYEEFVNPEVGVAKTKKVFENGLLKQIIIDDNGSIIQSEFFYNNHGDVSEERKSDGSTNKYEYIYDQNGNWVRRIHYLDGKPQSYEERAIKYF